MCSHEDLFEASIAWPEYRSFHGALDANPADPGTGAAVEVHLLMSGPGGASAVAKFNIAAASTVSELRTVAVAKWKRALCAGADAEPAAWLLRESGRHSFLVTPHMPLLAYDCVRAHVQAAAAAAASGSSLATPLRLTLVAAEREPVTESAPQPEHDDATATTDADDASALGVDPCGVAHALLGRAWWLRDDSEESDDAEDEPADASASAGVTTPPESINVHDCDRSFRTKLVGVQHIASLLSTPSDVGEDGDPDGGGGGGADAGDMYVCVHVLHGTWQPLSLPATSMSVPQQSQYLWNQWLEVPSFPLNALNRSTHVRFTLFRGHPQHSPSPLAWTNLCLVDAQGMLRTGEQRLRLWPGCPGPHQGSCGPPLPATGVERVPSLIVELDSFVAPVYCPLVATLPRRGSTEAMAPVVAADPDVVEQLKCITPMQRPTPTQLATLWRLRNSLRRMDRFLPLVMHSVSWTERTSICEAHRLIAQWATPSPDVALQLLLPQYADAWLRLLAVNVIANTSDSWLRPLLPQLVQAMKVESDAWAPLFRMLLSRALKARVTIGATLYWLMRAELHDERHAFRFSAWLQAYSERCGPLQLRQFQSQVNVMQQLAAASQAVAEHSSRDARDRTLQDRLSALTLPDDFCLPLDPRLRVSSLCLDQCRWMSSKKVPLLLTWRNADASGDGSDDTIVVLFKSGDDLRQDALTLQLIRLMTRWWLDGGLDLCMSPYSVVSTGWMEGMLEIVTNSATTSRIQATIKNAFAADVITNWLRSNVESEGEWTRVVDRFARSVAGYCVATFVLGIGDRHNDNIMCTRDGRLFHIDFGHFLGNFKSKTVKLFPGVKVSIRRERAPFVFTPQFCDVLGGEDSAEYGNCLRFAQQAYVLVRQHVHVLETLLLMMLPAGIPQLGETQDVGYMENMMRLDLSEDDAREHMSASVARSLRTKAQQFNEAIHNARHRTGTDKKKMRQIGKRKA